MKRVNTALVDAALLTATILAAVLLAAAFPVPARADIHSTEVPLLPEVTDDMTRYEYWIRNDPESDLPLTDARQRAALNAAMVREEACNMYDLYAVPGAVSEGLPSRLAQGAARELEGYVSGKYYDRSGNRITAELAAAIAANCQNASYEGVHGVSYGIAVRRTDLRAFPTGEIITDELGDINFDYVQLSSVRVNEPMILQSVSADGRYYYGYTNNCSGWVAADDIALCADRPQWLGAWNIPEERTLVVLDNRIYLDESNTDPEVSSLMLTQGTLLELAYGPGIPALITNRSRQYNYAVFIPIRQADGSYARKAALISKHYDVSVGFPSLTRGNLLRTAFNMLGDSYGWGGMLGSDDCSGYIRGIYRCFGLELPRNTTWQSKAPAVKYDLSGMSAGEKEAVLSGLPAGATLFFSGHEMLYLGSENGNYYVISSVSTVADPFGPGLNRMRLRSVVINTLDIRRMNGRSWLDNLHTALIPYAAQ